MNKQKRSNKGTKARPIRPIRPVHPIHPGPSHPIHTVTANAPGVAPSKRSVVHSEDRDMQMSVRLTKTEHAALLTIADACGQESIQDFMRWIARSDNKVQEAVQIQKKVRKALTKHG